MDHQDTSAEREDSPRLDLEGLLGAGRVFDSTGDQRRQAELIEAGCNRIGNEGPPPPP